MKLLSLQKQIHGLRNHLDMNGCLARVIEADDEAQRYEVRTCQSGQLLRVKFDNLVEVKVHPSTVMNAQPLICKDNSDSQPSARQRTPRQAAAPKSALDAQAEEC